MPTTQPHKSLQLLYGKAGMSITVPDSAVVLEGATIPPLTDADAVLRDALAAPIGCDPLSELLARKRPKSVAITISDITRPVPNQVIMSNLLRVINDAGIADEQVVIIVGTGMHRPSTPQEKVELLGCDILARCEVIDHRAEDPATLKLVSDDPPVSLCARFVDVDFRIVTGLIEPHFMAGYSGGRKGVCPALADKPTVQRFHNYTQIADPRSTTDNFDGNPVHAESLRVATLLGVDFIVNVAIDRQRRPAGFYCGQLEQAHLAGCAQVGQWTSVNFDRPFDLIITNGGGYPLDQTFYQSVKGMVTPLAAMHEQTIVLIVSHCGEGIGSPQYTDIMMRWGSDWRGFLQHIASNHDVVKDQWQYQMHARTLERIGVDRLRFVCDALDICTQHNLAVNPVEGDGNAAMRTQRFIDRFVSDHPAAHVGVIPEGPYINPVPLA